MRWLTPILLLLTTVQVNVIVCVLLTLTVRRVVHLSLDRRLANKAQVLGLLLAAHPDRPLAISADFLAANPVYHDRIGETRFVVLTDASGANLPGASVEHTPQIGRQLDRWSIDP